MKEDDLDDMQWHYEKALEVMSLLSNIDKGDYTEWGKHLHESRQINFEKIDTKKVAKELASRRAKELLSLKGAYSFQKEVEDLKLSLDYFQKMANDVITHYGALLLHMKNELKKEREENERNRLMINDLNIKQSMELEKFSKALEQDYYNQTEASEILEVSVRSIQNWIKDRRLRKSELQPGQRNISREALIERKEDQLRGLK